VPGSIKNHTFVVLNIVAGYVIFIQSGARVGQKMFIINNLYGGIITLDKNFMNKYTKKSKKHS